MNIQRKSFQAMIPRRGEFHVLTYAEEGFSPLNLHTKGTRISKEQLIAFSAIVNDRNEPGSLYPLASVSAVPRSLLRDSNDSVALSLAIADFYRVNASNIQAAKLLIDFRTPSVEHYVYQAIALANQSSDADLFEEMVVVDDDAHD